MKKRVFTLISCLLILTSVLFGCVNDSSDDGSDDGTGNIPDNSQSGEQNDEKGSQSEGESDPYENDREWNLQ